MGTKRLQIKKKSRPRRRSHERFDDTAAHEDTQDKWRWVYRGIFYVFLICFLVASAYALMYAPFLKVNQIVVDGAQRVTAQSLRADIDTQIGGKMIASIPRRNLLFVDRTALESFILDQYQEVKTVTITKVFPQELRVSVVEYERIVILCESGRSGDVDVVLPLAQARCLEIDSLGMRSREVVSQDNRYRVNPVLRIDAKEFSAAAFEQGDQRVIVDPEIIATLVALVGQFPYTIDTQIIGVPLLTFLGSGHARLQTDEGWDVLVDARSDSRLTLAVLRAFFTQTDEEDLRRAITEVDVRVVEKVFYRMKGGEQTVIEEVIVEDAAGVAPQDDSVDDDEDTSVDEEDQE